MSPDDTPLITESTVEAFQRARDEQGAPASPQSERVGALTRLFELIRSCSSACEAAAARASSPSLAHDVQCLAGRCSELSSRIADEIRSLGGSVDGDAAGSLPHDAASFAYVQSDDTLTEHLAENRRAIENAWNEATSHGSLSESLVSAHDDVVRVSLT